MVESAVVEGRDGKRLSVSTPNLVTSNQVTNASTEQDKQGMPAVRKLQFHAIHKHIAGKLRTNKHNKLESAHSETNISAIPHNDLEFPCSSELITIKDSSTSKSGNVSKSFRLTYQDWKILRRGTKYGVPCREFSLFWVMLSVSPNKRFKVKLYADPDLRQSYIHWDTQIGIITYFDGIRTYKVECMTTVERHDVWCVSANKQTLQVSCNFETVAKWKLAPDHSIVSVQPVRFGGKYFLTEKNGLPPRNSSNDSQQSLSLVELDGNNSTVSTNINEEDSEFGSSQDEYDQKTIKYSSMQEAKDQCLPGVSLELEDERSPLHKNVHQSNSFPEDIFSANHRENSKIEMVKVKRLSTDLVSLIGQLEADFRVNDNSFKQKIRSLDSLSRNMVLTLKTMQRETRDSRTEFKKREAEQLNYSIALEDRIGRLEDLLNGSDYNSLSEGFTEVIQQYIETDAFNGPARHQRRFTDFKEQIEFLTIEMNDKLKSLNKRIKTDQSTLVKEMMFIKDTVEKFREKTQAVLMELESGVNSRAEGNLSCKYLELVKNSEEKFLKIEEQLTNFELKLDTLDRSNNCVPDIQEDSRLEDLEQTCRNLMEMLNKQNLQIEALKRENLEIRSNFSNLIGAEQ